MNSEEEMNRERCDSKFELEIGYFFPVIKNNIRKI